MHLIDDNGEQFFGSPTQARPEGPTSKAKTYAPPAAVYGPIYGPPVVVAPPPTDAQVIAGTILGIAGLAIDASMYRRH
jgi:hypothetical protein